MTHIVEHCAVVVLAAGTSSRLGSPKQLLIYQGKSLLQHATAAAVQTNLQPVVIVVGADSDALSEQGKERNYYVVENKDWKEGMASSLRCGVTAVQQIAPAADGVILMVCDQPYVTTSVLNGLIQAQHQTGLPVVASNYGNMLGTPALFHKSLFTELMELTGDTGARSIIRRYEELVATIAFPKGIIDIDTQKDYEALSQ